MSNFYSRRRFWNLKESSKSRRGDWWVWNAAINSLWLWPINSLFCSFSRLFPLVAAYASKVSKLVRLFLNGAIKIVNTAPWPHYRNKNVFSDRRKLLYDKSASFRCESTRPAAENALSPKVLYVRVTTHVRLAVEVVAHELCVVVTYRRLTASF